MVVFVKVEFIGKPPYKERQGMIQAATHLTKDPKTVDVAVDDERENTLMYSFRGSHQISLSRPYRAGVRLACHIPRALPWAGIYGPFRAL
jgi:hypothetical protein